MGFGNGGWQCLQRWSDYVIEDPESVGGPLVVLGAIAIGTILLFLAQLLSLPTFKKIYNSSPQVRTR